MSGKNLSLACLLVLCAGLEAQGLPKLPQLEMENFRLALLDDQSKPEGSLEGKLARSKRDGTVEIEGAVLTLLRGDGKLVARAEKFVYTPGAEAFDCPSGLAADLPDGGKFNAPVAKGTLTRGPAPRREVLLKFTCTGMLTVRGGEQDKASLRSAEIADPEVEMRLADPSARKDSAKPGAKKPVLAIVAKGKRGGSVHVLVKKAPDMVPAAVPDTKEDKPPMLLMLSCFGDIELDLNPEKDSGNISMQRRARMALDNDPPTDKPAEPLEITANLLRVRGKVVEVTNKEGKTEQALEDVEIDGVDTVHISGPRFVGFGDQFEYRQVGMRHDTRLMRGPTADILLTPEETEEGKRAFLRMKARDAISISSQTDARPDAPPPPVTVKLQSGAQVWREVGGAVEFHLVGSEVEMTTHAVKETKPPDDKGVAEEYLRWVVDAFRVVSEGYSPMLRIAGMSTSGDTNLDAGQRAAVFGSRVEGTVDAAGMLRGKAFGPEILAILFADYGLADEMRYALNLRKRPEDFNPPRQRLPRPGRMEVRAMATLDLEITTLAVKLGETPKPLGVKAAGNVRLDHTPLPRDDRDLLTLAGESLWLVLGGMHFTRPDVAKGEELPKRSEYQNPRLERAELTPTAGADCLATLGYDLLISRGFQFDAAADRGSRQMTGVVSGPGRMVIRDKESIGYFSRIVQRLPRRAEAPDRQMPDAGWMNFGGDITVRADEDTRTLDATQAQFQLVFGEFEEPRAGQSALKDLAELIEPEVRQLYLAQGRRLLLVSSGYASGENEKERSLVNLLRLEGDALLRDFGEGLEASARESIEATGADDQSSPGNPLAVVLLGQPRVVMRQAGAFFGEVVTRGAFAYDGRWALTAGERLEITFRPLAMGDHESLKVIRGDLQALQYTHDEAVNYVMRISRAVRMMRELAAQLPPEETPETEQARQALRYAEAAAVQAGQCHMREASGARDSLLRSRMARNARRAHDLLAGLIDLAAMGGVEGEFAALDEVAPSLRIEMQRIIMSFNGLGEVVETRGEGPVKVSRAEYTITGSKLTRTREGALLLDGAAINLPENTGVKIAGVKTISLHSAPGTDGGAAVPVTRVSGKGLKISVDLSRSTP